MKLCLFRDETAGWEKDGHGEIMGQFLAVAAILQKSRDDFGISLPWVVVFSCKITLCEFGLSEILFILKKIRWKGYGRKPAT